MASQFVPDVVVGLVCSLREHPASTWRDRTRESGMTDTGIQQDHLQQAPPTLLNNLSRSKIGSVW